MNKDEGIRREAMERRIEASETYKRVRKPQINKISPYTETEFYLMRFES